jgi:SAM-dependent methyltransferase
MKPQIFISYSRNDEHEAKKITNVLDELKIDYFKDVKDIEWGKSVQNEVTVALSDCHAVLVVISPGSVKSQWVPYEIGYAMALKKRILPYLTHESITIPGYISNLNYTTSLDTVRNTFSSTWSQNILLAHSQPTEEKLESKYLDWWEEQNQIRNDEEVRFEGLNFWVDRRVFSPSLRMSYSSFLASKFLKDVKGKRVLDVGTGCGVLAILAAKRNAKKVVAIDIDQIAVTNTKKNVTKFKYGKIITVFQGDLFSLKDSLFEDIDKKFDIIVSNLPIAIRAKAWSHLETDLPELLERWAKELPNYLSSNGVAYLTWASFGDDQLLAKILSVSGLKVRDFEESTFGIKWQLFEVRLKRG